MLLGEYNCKESEACKLINDISFLMNLTKKVDKDNGKTKGPFGCWNKMGWNGNENGNGNGNGMEWNDYFITMFGMVGNGME